MLDAELLQPRRHAEVMWSVSYFVVWVDCVSESSVLRYIEHRWAAVAG
jgi:REP element-mobilizing transposase RayT